MASRRKLRRNRDKKVYSRTAEKTKKINIAPKIMRGGIRL